MACRQRSFNFIHSNQKRCNALKRCVSADDEYATPCARGNAPRPPPSSPPELFTITRRCINSLSPVHDAHRMFNASNFQLHRHMKARQMRQQQITDYLCVPEPRSRKIQGCRAAAPKRHRPLRAMARTVRKQTTSSSSSRRDNLAL